MVYYTAITIKLNVKPWIHNGVTSAENYTLQLSQLITKFKVSLDLVTGWELDKQCQLHFHGTLVSTKIIHRMNICKWYRRTFKKHSIWLVPITDLSNWRGYCNKAGNDEEKYHWLCRYYNNNYPEWQNKKLIFSNKLINLDNIKLNSKNHWEKSELISLNPEFI